MHQLIVKSQNILVENALMINYFPAKYQHFMGEEYRLDHSNSLEMHQFGFKISKFSEMASECTISQ